MDQRCSLITQWKCCGTEAGGGFKIRIRKILRATVFSSFVPTMIKGKFKNNFLKINNFFLVRAGCCKKFVKNSKKPSFLLELEPAKKIGAGKKQTGSATLHNCYNNVQLTLCGLLLALLRLELVLCLAEPSGSFPLTLRLLPRLLLLNLVLLLIRAAA